MNESRLDGMHKPHGNRARIAPKAPKAPEEPLSDGRKYAASRAENERLKAEDRRISLDEKRGRLIDKAKTLETVQRLARQERDAILSWPARVAPIIAAELGADEHLVLTLLDNSLRAHLAERAEVALDL